MLSLILAMVLFPFRLCFEIFLIPWRIIGGLFRSGSWVRFLVVIGLFSITGGLVSFFAGLLKDFFPWILIAAGIAMIYFANRKNPEPREEVFESFYSQHRNTQNG